MKNYFLTGFLVLTFVFSFSFRTIASSESINVKVTILQASNEGSDFDLDNDAYRDQLIQLFSYTSYSQLDVKGITLDKAARSVVELPEGYELVLTYQGSENGREMVQTLVRKNTTQYVYTLLSIQNPGVVFVGGPNVKEGVLVIVLETGF